MITANYTVEYSSSNGQPSRDYGGPYASRTAAIVAARECVRQCLLRNSGGSVSVFDEQHWAPIWWWTEYIEGGYGGQVMADGTVIGVRV